MWLAPTFVPPDPRDMISPCTQYVCCKMYARISYVRVQQTSRDNGGLCERSSVQTPPPTAEPLPTARPWRCARGLSQLISPPTSCFGIRSFGPRQIHISPSLWHSSI